MFHVVVSGCGAALAQPVIRHYLDRFEAEGSLSDCWVTGLYRKTKSPIDRTSFFQLQEDLAPRLQPVDVLVTMHGRADDAKIADMGVTQWERAIQDNLTSVFHVLHDCLPLVRDGGNVVVTGSVVGSTGGYGCANYAAAKAGLLGLVRAAANEHARRGVCVNLLELGFCDAGMGARLPDKVREAALGTIPLRRFASEEDVVAAVDYLARTRYMTGGVLTLAGGLR